MRAGLNNAKKTIAIFGVSLILLAANGCNGTPEVINNTADSVKNAQAQQNIPGSPIKYDATKRYIYLTWDDGPQPPGTNICRNIFHTQGAKASFFMVGFNMIDARRKRMVDTIRNSYPEFLLCNHTFTHANQNKYSSYYHDLDSAVRDVAKNKEALNVPLKILRTPGNNSWMVNGQAQGPKLTRPFCQRLDSIGYSVIGWDVEWSFKNGNIPIQGVDELLQKIDDMYLDDRCFTSNHLVLLAHDRMFEKPQYSDSLIKFVSILKKDPRYIFETLDHYPGVKPNK